MQQVLGRRTAQARVFLFFERALWLAGIVSLSVFIAVQIQQRAGARDALEQFYSRQPTASFVDGVEHVIVSANTETWSPARVASFEHASLPAAGEAVAVLRIPRLTLEAPVFEGALEHELDRGPGWIRGTAPVGSAGNIGIAGHRDGFFRSLKDIRQDDVIEVVGRISTTRYRVTDTWIVAPDAVHVLDATDDASLTLVTCYPFYFVGHAPERFIVRAVAEAI
jgi:sortase A